MNTPTSSPPGVKIDKQTTLRLTSKKQPYIDSDVSSILSENHHDKRKPKKVLRKLQWRSSAAASAGDTKHKSTTMIPPSTSPLSRKLGASLPSINNIVVEGRGDYRDDGTVVSRKSVGTTVTAQTRKCSNRRMVGRGAFNSDASVSSSVNSRLPPLARLRKRIPAIHEDSPITQIQEEEAEEVLGSSITISTISNETNYVNCSTEVPSPLKQGVQFESVDSPTSVIPNHDFFGGDADPVTNNIHANPTSKRAFSKRGETLSTIKSGKPIYIERVGSTDSSTIENTNNDDYRNAMNRMRKLMTSVPEAEQTPESDEVVHGNNDKPLDTSSMFADLEHKPNHLESNTNGEEEESITQTIRLPGPIDVDTCTRHVTPMERRNLRAMHKLGYNHLRNNEINSALDVFMEILRGQKERHGKKSLEVAMAMHNLGVVCVKGGRFEEGTRLCDGAARIRVEKLGPNHLDVAVSLAQQGVALMEIQQYTLALASFREALRIRQIHLGPKHPLIIRLLNNIGCALFEMNELEEAKEAFDVALVVQRELMKDSSLGGNCSEGLTDDQGNDLELDERNLEVDPKEAHNMLLSIALTQCNLGSIHLRWGKYDDSLVFYEDALLIQESVLGEDHKVVLNTRESMDFIVKSKEENRQALLENHTSPSSFPSILNMDQLTNLILPRYEEGKKIYDKVSKDIAALLDTVTSPVNETKHRDANLFETQDNLYSMEAFVCGQPLLCSDETEMNS